MSAEFESGFSVREPMWHGLGTILEDYPGREEAMKIAGHDFKILERSILVNKGKELGGRMTIDQNDWKALIREDTGDIISLVRGSYVPVQNDRMWDIVDAIVSEDNVKYETAGVLRGGAVLWVLARIDEPQVVPGDNSEIYPYVFVSGTHDGTGALKAQAVSVRVVCWNTFQAADAQAHRSGRQFTFNHTKNVESRIDVAKEALGLVRVQHSAFMDLANELADIPVNEDSVKDFLSMFIPDPPADLITDRQKANIDAARQEVKELVDMSPTIPAAHRRTAYGLWSAGIEWLDYGRRSRSNESLFRRTMIEPTSEKKRLADLVHQVA